MFLVFFPVSGVEEQVINHPTDAFCCFDTNMENEAKDVIRILISQFGLKNLHIYNTSENRSDSWFNSIGDLVNDINGQELGIDDNLWSIDLNLTEEQMREVTDHYSSDFVIKDGRSNCLLCFEDGEMIAYGDYEEARKDFHDDDKLYALFSNYDKDTDKCTIHVFKVLYDSYEKIGEIELDCDWHTKAEEWKKMVYPKLCDLLKT